MAYNLQVSRSTETAMSPHRLLGAFEKLFWLSDSKRPNHFAIAAEIDGTASDRAWQSAVDALVRKDQTPLAAIDRNQHGEPEFERGHAARLPVHFVEAPVTVWRGHLARHLAQPFLQAESPMVRVTVIHDADRTAVVLSAHHSIADAKALVYWLRDLLTLVSGGTVVRSVGKGSIESLVGRKLGELPRITVKLPEPRFAPRVLSGCPPTIELASLTISETARLRETARARSTTVHGALCAAFGGALREIEHREHPLTILSPIDLRHRVLDGAEHLGLCMIGLPVIETDLNADFWDRARAFSDVFNAFLVPDAMRQALAMMEGVAADLTTASEAMDAVASMFGGDILLSNIGDMRLPTRYGDLTLDAVWGPSVTLDLEGAQTIGVVTHNGSLRLVHTSYGPVPGLLAAAVAKLVAVAA